MISKHAFELLANGEHDKLESELHKIDDSYRFCNRLRESAQEQADKATKELVELRVLVLKLAEEKVQLLTERGTRNEAFRQLILTSNAQAQGRMEEIERLRAALAAATKG